ncbi:hypothetical protein ACSAZK_03625 [Methanosarcina sp. Mfa9]|uniref:hypothetical protein n=1 Tax=Methanosarcina sp. Mfa9 TaxID=3439063 RepID=UPI003F8279D0
MDLAKGEISAHVGFRVVTSDLIAGGPIELEFFVENLRPFPFRLAVSGDRMRQRPGQFSFSATFEGSPLGDPIEGVPYMGGPMGIVQVATDIPWHQSIVLNQFLCLEDTPRRLVQGTSGRIDLVCNRQLSLAITDADALSHNGALVVAVNLSFDIRRDDEALEELASSLLNEIMTGPLDSRERPLALLLSMRKAAHAQIDALTKHPDESVARRARQAMSSFCKNG